MGKNFLEDIVAHKKRLLEEKKAFFHSLKAKAEKTPPKTCGSFQRAISAPDKVNLIAEIKKASPSRGVIRPLFDPVDLAKIYSTAGAAALSVLTEEKYFLGKPEYITEVSKTVSLPILTKDFIISPEQIYETFLQGTSAVLLIVSILSEKELKNLLVTAGALGLDALVETHDEEEIKKALGNGAKIIGVNSRNLKTLEVDFQTFETLIPRIPKNKTIVAESGIKSRAQIAILKDLGAHAVLIGEAFLRGDDIALKIKEMMNG